MREMTLKEVMELIKTEANLTNPLHLRSMQLLKVRKTSTHSDFLQQLEKMMEVVGMELYFTIQVSVSLFCQTGRLHYEQSSHGDPVWP